MYVLVLAAKEWSKFLAAAAAAATHSVFDYLFTFILAALSNHNFLFGFVHAIVFSLLLHMYNIFYYLIRIFSFSIS